LGNLRSLAAHSELGHRQTGIEIDSEDEFAPLASSRKNASHASWHDLPLRKIQNDTNTVQAAYHPAWKTNCTQTEGLDLPSTTAFT